MSCIPWYSIWATISRSSKVRDYSEVSDNRRKLIILDMDETMVMSAEGDGFTHAMRNPRVMQAIIKLSGCDVAIASHGCLSYPAHRLQCAQNFLGTTTTPPYVDLYDVANVDESGRSISINSSYQRFSSKYNLGFVPSTTDFAKRFVDQDKSNMILYLLRAKNPDLFSHVTEVILVDDRKDIVDLVNGKEKMGIRFSAIHADSFTGETREHRSFFRTRHDGIRVTTDRIDIMSNREEPDRIPYPIQLAKATGVHARVLAKKKRKLNADEKTYWNFYQEYLALKKSKLTPKVH